MSMQTGEWWDDAAPYGANGYEYGRGEVIRNVSVLREVTFEMMPGDPNCTARGVAEMTDGRVYQFTILRDDHGRERDGRRRVRFASLSRQPFHELARGLLDSEVLGKRVTPESAARYGEQISTL